MKFDSDFWKKTNNKLHVGVSLWKKVSGYISPVLEEAMAFKEKPGLIAGARMAMRLHSHAEKIMGKPTEEDNIFHKDEWETVCIGYEFDMILYEELESQAGCMKTLFNPNDSRKIKLNCDGYTIGVDMYKEKPNLYVRTEEKEAVLKYFCELFWKKFGDSVSFVYKDNIVEISEFKLSNAFPTALSLKYAEELKKYKESGYGRSLLFYGPPGTGKSNTCAQILQNCGWRTIVFPSMFTNIGWWQKNLPLCRPDAILIEDIDHFTGNQVSSILATLEYFYKEKIVILATCNKVANLDDAIIRAERFDELVEIAELPDEVTLGILGNDRLVEMVRGFPIAAVLELKRRIEILGEEEAIKRSEDLLIRVERANSREEYKLKRSGK